MRRAAFAAALAVLIYVLPLGGVLPQALTLLGAESPPPWLLIAMMVVATVIAHFYTDLLLGNDDIPDFLHPLPVAAALCFFGVELLSAFDLIRVRGDAHILFTASNYALAICGVMLARALRPRLMLALCLFVMALQWRAATLLAPLLPQLPSLVWSLLALGAAIGVARWLALADDSPADRHTETRSLGLFAAAAAFVFLMTDNHVRVEPDARIFTWLAFLATFLWFVDCVEPHDLDHKPAALGPSYGLMAMVFVALTVVIAEGFRVRAIVKSLIPERFDASNRLWWPLAAAAALALAAMLVLKLFTRMRDEAPGKRLLVWGMWASLFVLLVGGQIASAESFRDGSRTLPELVGFALGFKAIAPVALAAQVLLTLGLLRILFYLDPRRPNY